MTEAQRLTNLIEEVHRGTAWHGPSLAQALEGVDEKIASARLHPFTHTIWELVLHLTAWLEIMPQRYKGDHVEVTPERDWPSRSGSTHAEWTATLEALWRAEAAFRTAISTISENRYETPVEADEGTVELYRALYGMIAHCAYHSGQISLLKKALTTSS
jgi:uncharacterized damage-inducible protein DinB